MYTYLTEIVDKDLKTERKKRWISYLMSEKTLGEGSGYIFIYQDRVDLVRNSYFSDEMRNSISKFVEGDNSQLEQLVETGTDIIKKHILNGSDTGEILAMSAAVQQLKKVSEKRNKLSKEQVNNALDMYKELVLSTYTKIPSQTEIPDDCALGGLFHIHASGTPPSSTDITASKKMDVPMYVFCGNKELEEIYKVSKGEVSRI